MKIKRSHFLYHLTKKGYSKISSWIGNGNADGTFVYTGFRPAFILFKAIATAENWMIYDDKNFFSILA